MSTINAANVQTFDGNRTIPVSRIKSGTAIAHIKCWTSGSTIQIKNSYNVNSVTYNASGQYIITLSLTLALSGIAIITSSGGMYNQDVESNAGSTPYSPAYPNNQQWKATLAATSSNQIYVSNFYTYTNQYLADGMMNIIILSNGTES